jgi:hypothetical protein
MDYKVIRVRMSARKCSSSGGCQVAFPAHYFRYDRHGGTDQLGSVGILVNISHLILSYPNTSSLSSWHNEADF